MNHGRFIFRVVWQRGTFVLYAMGIREIDIEMLVLYLMAIFMVMGFGSLVAKQM